MHKARGVTSKATRQIHEWLSDCRAPHGPGQVLENFFVSVKAEDGLKRQRRYEILILEKS